LATDGSEADFDLQAMLEALESIEDEATICNIAEAVLKEFGPEDQEEEAARAHVANLIYLISRSRLSAPGPSLPSLDSPWLLT
jgi:hypothetical protein